MAYRPPIECMLCHEDIDPDRNLEDHLMNEHSKRELAEKVVVDFEEDELDSDID